MRHKLETLWVIVILAAIGYVGWSGNEDSRRINHLISSQLQNRVTNVATWCAAINQDRDTARARAIANHLTPYLLSNLDCRKLEQTTAESSR